MSFHKLEYIEYLARQNLWLTQLKIKLKSSLIDDPLNVVDTVAAVFFKSDFRCSLLIVHTTPKVESLEFEARTAAIDLDQIL